MADRILTWHTTFSPYDSGLLWPPYYIEADYEPIAVRISGDRAPITHDVEVDILDDGVSIFANRATTYWKVPTAVGPVEWSDPVKTTAVLPIGDTEEVDAEDFNNNPIEKGSWVSCKVVERDGLEKLVVHLELLRISERDEPEE